MTKAGHETTAVIVNGLEDRKVVGESRSWKARGREEEGGVRFRSADYGLRLNVVPSLIGAVEVLQGPRSRLLPVLLLYHTPLLDA